MLQFHMVNCIIHFYLYLTKIPNLYIIIHIIDIIRLFLQYTHIKEKHYGR